MRRLERKAVGQNSLHITWGGPARTEHTSLATRQKVSAFMLFCRPCIIYTHTKSFHLHSWLCSPGVCFCKVCADYSFSILGHLTVSEGEYGCVALPACHCDASHLLPTSIASSPTSSIHSFHYFLTVHPFSSHSILSCPKCRSKGLTFSTCNER